MIENIFENLKKYIYYISLIIILLLLISCIKNGFQIFYLYDFFTTLFTSIVFFFLIVDSFIKMK